MAKLNKKSQVFFDELKAEILATADGFTYADPAQLAPLVKAGLVEINETMQSVIDNVTCIAVRLTNQEQQQDQDATGVAAPAIQTSKESKKTMYKIEDSVAIPAISGRGRTGNTYPFDEMEVNQSFFVPATAEMENPAKSLASTVSSANARYAVEVEGETRTNRKGNIVPVTKLTRQFIVRGVTENGVKGARVWRVL